MKKKHFLIAAALLMGLSIYSCKKELNPSLDQVIPSAITPRYLNSIVLGAYTKLQPLTGSSDIIFNSEGTTDALCLPVRIGGDWLDGSTHIQLWLHTYTKGHGEIAGAWDDLYNGVGQINITIGLLQGLPATSTSAASIAELKTLRDYFYYLLLTNYGNIPYIVSSSTNAATAPTTPAATVYNDLVAELIADAPLLSSKTPALDPSQYGRLNQWGAYFLLAKLYMNQNAITGSTDNSGYTNASKYLDLLLASGYSLSGNFLSNFASGNNVGNTENIFVIPYDHIASTGFNLQMMTFHYNQAAKYNWGSTGGPWNGFCANADYYGKFDNADARKAGWQHGIQYAADGVTPLTTRGSDSGLVLNFRPQVTGGFDGIAKDDATEYDGVRQQKWQLTPGFQGMDADFAIMRYSDVLLMKAECLYRLGDPATALTFTAPVRQRAGLANFGAAFTLDSIYNERGREFAWEGWRKEDQIRFGHFGDPKQFKPLADANKNAQLFPIPTEAIQKNPGLIQNPGY
jgi:starch-binding outer membrane protein, SusD/RagB family